MERGERRPVTVSLGPSRGRRESKRPRTACRSSSGRSRRLTEQRWVQAPLLHGAPATPQLVVEDDRPPGLGERPERQQVVVGNSRAAAVRLVGWFRAMPRVRPLTRGAPGAAAFQNPRPPPASTAGARPGSPAPPTPPPAATLAPAEADVALGPTRWPRRLRPSAGPSGRQAGSGGGTGPGLPPRQGTSTRERERARAGLLPRSSPRRGGVKGGGGMWRLGGGFKGGS